MKNKRLFQVGLGSALGVLLTLNSPLILAKNSPEAAKATTAELVELCSQTDLEAQNFCFGFSEGVYQTYTLAGQKKGRAQFCAATPEDTRAETRKKFLAWSKAHPELDLQPAAGAVIRFLKAQYPCR